VIFCGLIIDYKFYLQPLEFIFIANDVVGAYFSNFYNSSIYMEVEDFDILASIDGSKDTRRKNTILQSLFATNFTIVCSHFLQTTNFLPVK